MLSNENFPCENGSCPPLAQVERLPLGYDTDIQDTWYRIHYQILLARFQDMRYHIAKFDRTTASRQGYGTDNSMDVRRRV